MIIELKSNYQESLALLLASSKWANAAAHSFICHFPQCSFSAATKASSALLSLQKWNQFSPDKPVGPSPIQNQPIKARSLEGGADLWMSPTLFRCLQHPFYLSRWPHLSREKWIHLFSQWAVGAAGLQKIRLWNQLGKEACWSVLAVPVCCCQAGWKHHRHTRRPSLSKNILKLRFSFGMTPLLRSLETYLVWHDERRDSLNFNTLLCYCAMTV